MCRWLDTGAVDLVACAERVAEGGYVVLTPEEHGELLRQLAKARELLEAVIRVLEEVKA